MVNRPETGEIRVYSNVRRATCPNRVCIATRSRAASPSGRACYRKRPLSRLTSPIRNSSWATTALKRFDCLKDQLQTELNNAGISSARDDAESRLIDESSRWIPLRVVERIKEFGTELRVHLLADLSVLHQCQVHIIDARSCHRRTSGRA